MEIILGRFKNNKVFICAFLTACYTGMRTGEVFALTWNDIDLVRSKQQVHSVLDDIPNIGQTRRKALMRQFQSLEKIREATVEQLREVDGMNEKAARSVYEFFHKQ